MPLFFSCQTCGHTLKAKEEHAGRRLKCPRCENAVLVPAATADAPTGAGPREQPTILTPPEIVAPFRLVSKPAPRDPGKNHRRDIPIVGAVRGWWPWFTRLNKGTWKNGNDVWDYIWKNTGANLINRGVMIVMILLALGVGVQYALVYSPAAFDQTPNAWKMPFATVFLVGVVGVAAWGWQRPISMILRGVVTLTVVHIVLGAGFIALISLALAALIHLGALLILAVLALGLFPIVWIAGKISARRRLGQCPYDECGLFSPPIYLCSCGARHANLRPSLFGLFYHTCRHPDGRRVRLPTMDWLGRNKLSRLCRGCDKPIEMRSFGRLPERAIMVVGGPNVGKTLMMSQAVRQLVDRLRGRRLGSAVLDGDLQTQGRWQYSLDSMDRGCVLPTSPESQTLALAVAVRCSTPKVYALVHLFDTPGSNFASVVKLSRKKVIARARGIILVVDPFGLPFLATHAQRMKPALQPSETPFNEVVATLVQVINSLVVEQATDRCDIPLAVVISKADVLPFEEFPFLADLMPETDGSGWAKRSKHCRTALEKLGAAGPVRALEMKFDNVEYFACTATGRLPVRGDSSPLTPCGTAAPLLWLLGLE
jgi:DNA-directed RNA polymerase subunit RPC12/RpoP/GTPase SAR1 family protein